MKTKQKRKWKQKWKWEQKQFVHRKYNLFFWFKNKKNFENFSFFIFQFQNKNWKMKEFFRNSFFNFKSKNELENLKIFLNLFWFKTNFKKQKSNDFCFLELVLNQNKFKKIFFSFLVFQFNNQIWKMKDIFWNSFFHFKPKNKLQNCNLHFLKFVSN